MTISGSPHNLGTILSANTIACRLFGYARWQLVRRNVSCLVPSPLSEAHDAFLRAYLRTGEGNVVDYTVSHHLNDAVAMAPGQHQKLCRSDSLAVWQSGSWSVLVLPVTAAALSRLIPSG